MYDHDRSASKGYMSARKLIVYKHVGTDTDADQRKNQAKLGCAPAHKLLDITSAEPIVTVRPLNPEMPPRTFADYAVTVYKDRVPSGVELIELL